MYNVLAKFQLFCVITCRDILYFVFWLPYYHILWRHLYLICTIHKSWISLERDEIWQKGKHHSSYFLKAFQTFNTSIFYFVGTLTNKTLFNVNRKWQHQITELNWYESSSWTPQLPDDRSTSCAFLKTSQSKFRLLRFNGFRISLHARGLKLWLTILVFRTNTQGLKITE